MNKRDRCRKGFSCGASCISRLYKCLRDLPSIVQGAIRKGADFIQSRGERLSSAPTPSRVIIPPERRVTPPPKPTFLKKDSKELRDIRGKLENKREKLKERLKDPNLSGEQRAKLERALKRNEKVSESITRELSTRPPLPPSPPTPKLATAVPPPPPPTPPTPPKPPTPPSSTASSDKILKNKDGSLKSPEELGKVLNALWNKEQSLRERLNNPDLTASQREKAEKALGKYNKTMGVIRGELSKTKGNQPPAQPGKPPSDTYKVPNSIKGSGSGYNALGNPTASGIQDIAVRNGEGAISYLDKLSKGGIPRSASPENLFNFKSPYFEDLVRLSGMRQQNEDLKEYVKRFDFGRGAQAEGVRKNYLDMLGDNGLAINKAYRSYANQDRKHWASLLKEINKLPGRDEEKLKLNDWVRENAQSIGTLFKMRLKGGTIDRNSWPSFTAKPDTGGIGLDLSAKRLSEGSTKGTQPPTPPRTPGGAQPPGTPRGTRVPSGGGRPPSGGGGGRVAPYPTTVPATVPASGKKREIVRKILNAIKELFSNLAKGVGEDSIIEKNLRKLANKLPKKQRDKALKKIDRAFPKKPDIAHKGPQNPKELLAASKKAMAPYEKSLKSAASLSRRGELLISRLEDRIKDVPKGTDEYNRLSKSISKARSKAARADGRLEVMMGQIQDEMKKTNLTRDEVKGLMRGVRIVGNTPDNVSVKRHIVSDTKDFIRMFNGLGVSKVDNEGKGDVGRSLSRIVIRDSRAHASPSSGLISVSPFVSKETTFHEMAHLMGRQRPWLEKMLSDWRDSRAFSRDEIKNEMVSWKGGKVRVAEDMRTSRGDIPLIRLKDIDKSYGSGELAVADRFISPYMGKVYKSGSSEILSMAVQHFANPWDMSTLYKTHPDLFSVIVGLSAQ